MAVRASVEVTEAVRQLALDRDDLDAALSVPDWQGRFVRAWAFVDRWRQQVQSAVPPSVRAWTIRPTPDEYEQQKMKLRNGSLASSAHLLGACHAALVGSAPITFGDHEVNGTILRVRPRARNGARSHGDLLGHLCPAVTATRLDVVDGLLLNEMTFFDPNRPLFEAGEAVRVLAWPIWPDHPELRAALDPQPDVHLLARNGQEQDVTLLGSAIPPTTQGSATRSMGRSPRHTPARRTSCSSPS
jgi:hypothetical protein